MKHLTREKLDWIRANRKKELDSAYVTAFCLIAGAVLVILAVIFN